MGPLGTTPEAKFDAYYSGRDDRGGLSIVPGEVHTIIIVYTSLGSASVEGTLSITSSLPQKIVKLIGKSVYPPAMAVLPESLDVDLDAGSRSDRTITINNTGVSDLEYSITATPTSAPVSRSVVLYGLLMSDGWQAD